MPPLEPKRAWRRHGHAHPRVLLTALAVQVPADRNRSTTPDHHDVTPRRNQPRPDSPTDQGKRPLDTEPLFRHADIAHAAKCSLSAQEC